MTELRIDIRRISQETVAITCDLVPHLGATASETALAQALHDEIAAVIDRQVEGLHGE